MKNIFFFLSLLIMSSQIRAAILRVNNNPAVTGVNVYTTAQAAHNAANAGDTIHLEPTGNGTYGTLTLTKQVILIGTGDFVISNPGQQATFLPSGSCDVINFNAGCSGSKVFVKCGTINVTASVSDITISRCHITGSINFSNGVSCTNIAVKQNVIDYSFNASNTTINSLIFSNNYLGQGIRVSNTSSAVITYNVFGASQACCTLDFNNALFSNNIFAGIPSPYYLSFTNCNVYGNIAYSGNTLPAGNVNNVNMTEVFATWPATADKYQLKPTYPNQNVGMYAGPDPYKPACTPPVPSVYEIAIPVSTPLGSNLNITVSTKSNN